MGMTTSGKNAEDVMALCQILFGAEFMETHPVVTGNINEQSILSKRRLWYSHSSIQIQIRYGKILPSALILIKPSPP
jgi:hypothetical protein